MIILAKQKNHKSKLWIKEFDKVSDAAYYLKVTPAAIYIGAGKYKNTPCKIKGWYVDIVDSKVTETV